MAFWIAALSLPLIAGFHRYAASYGYRGVSRSQAWDEAWKTAAATSVFSVLFIAVKLVS
jgi:hypothetical protein